MTAERLDKLLVVVAVGVWFAAIVVQLATAGPLGHDEAAYAVGAQRMLAGDPQIWLHRSVGTSALALPGLALAGGETALRLGPALATLLVPLGGYALARVAIPDRRLGGWTAAALAGAHPMLAHTGELLGDLPSAGLLLVALALLVRELARPGGPSWWIVAAAPLLAGAFYIRYGCAPIIAAIVACCAIAYRRELVAQPRRVAAFVVVAAALAVPHVVFSLARTGEVLGVIAASAEATMLEYTGQGLVSYLTSNPFTLCGFAIAPLVLAGLVSAVAVPRRATRVIAAIAVLAFVAIGLRSHAQPRYLFPIVAMLVVIGIAGVDHAIGHATGHAIGHARRRLAAVIAIVIAVACWCGSLLYLTAATAKRREFRDQIERISGHIVRDVATAGDRPCLLVTFHAPQIAYYSGCKGEDWPDAPQGRRRVYVISFLAGHTIDPAGVSPAMQPLAGVDGVFVVDQ